MGTALIGYPAEIREPRTQLKDSQVHWQCMEYSSEETE